MPDILKKAIVKIKKENGDIAGTGFLVSDMKIVTCSHVIEHALEMDVREGSPLNKIVHLDFPFCKSPKTIKAKVVFMKSPELDGTHDIAGLNLIEYPPPDSKPVPVSTDGIEKLKDCEFKVCGWPDDYDTVVWSYGKVMDERDDKTIQLEDTKGTGRPIEEGFSGGAVWVESGMVKIRLRVKAFLIPFLFRFFDNRI